MGWWEYHKRPSGHITKVWCTYTASKKAKAQRKYLRERTSLKPRSLKLHAGKDDKLRVAVLRERVYEGYGAKCACCGESNRLFLQLDHVNNDGNVERRKAKTREIYARIIKEGFPSRYQILCANCNHGKERNGGICPHIEIMENPKAHREATTVPLQRTELPLDAFWNGTGHNA